MTISPPPRTESEVRQTEPREIFQSIYQFLFSHKPELDWIPQLIRSSPVEFYQQVDQQLILNLNQGPWAQLPSQWTTFLSNAFDHHPDPQSLLQHLTQSQSHVGLVYSILRFSH